MRARLEIVSGAMLLLTAAVTAQVQAAAHAQRQVQSRDGGARELPRLNFKTNLLWDAAATVNLGAEVRTGGRTSIDLPLNYNAWTFSDNRKWKHVWVQPELRFWPRETFDGHFFGLHAHAAQYNVGNLPHGPFSRYMKEHRFEGWLVGAGVSYGYRWNFSRHMAMEATVGAGYAYLDHDRFKCAKCGEKQAHESSHYFGPTRAGVSLIFGIGGKSKPIPQQVPLYVAPPEPVVPEPVVPEPVVPYEPTFAPSFVTPEVEAVKARNASGSAYLDFAVGGSEIVPDFRNNAAELQKIHTTIESVKNDPDVTITGITITGHASPEGTWESNQRLSERRAQALKEHIRGVHGLRDCLFGVSGAGEDWAGLDSLVSASGMVEKYRILEIIRGTGIFDGRESKLMALAGGDPYRRMMRELFPRLRRSDYVVDYTVAPFTVERGKEVLRTRPGNLSLNEMFLIAGTCEPGSDASGEIFETAARVYPDSDVANLNAAASALNRREAVSAARYLDRVSERSAPYWNNAGVLAWLRGDKTAAAECFAKAGAQGQANAAELRKHIESVNR